MMSEFNTTYVKKYRRGVVGSMVAMLFLALLFGGLGVVIGLKPTYDKLTTTWTETRADAVEQGTRSVSTGGRRTRRTEQRRTITFQYTVDEVTHTSTVLDGATKVGDTVNVWVSDSDADEISLGKPGPPSVWNWLGAAVGLLVIAGFALWFVSRVHRLVALSGVSPAHTKGTFVLDVQRISDKLANAQAAATANNISRTLQGVLATSTIEERPAGALAMLQGRGATTPPQHELAGPHEGYVFYSGWVTELALVRRQGATDWWVAELADIPKGAPSA